MRTGQLKPFLPLRFSFKQMIFSYFLCETVSDVSRVDQSWGCHSSSYDVVDRVDEAGLSSTDGSVEKDSEMIAAFLFRFIVLHILEVSVSVSVDKEFLLVWNKMWLFRFHQL